MQLESPSARAGVACTLALLAFALGLAGSPASAQQRSLPSEGVADRPVRSVALVNARVISEPGRVLESATVLLRDGRIEAVGPSVRVPTGTPVRDMGGATVFPGFIEVSSTLGLPADHQRGGIRGPQRGQPLPHDQQADQPGTPHWNRRARPERSAAAVLDYKPAEAKLLRELGFTAAHSLPQAGILAGQGALLSLVDEAPRRDALLAADTVQVFGLDFQFGQEYPGSLMGSLALIRQSLLDARWYAQRQSARPGRGLSPERLQHSQSLAELGPAAAGRQRVFMLMDDELDAGRFAAIRTEFNLDGVLVGSGHEYRLLPQLRDYGMPLVLPLSFPEVPAVEQPGVALQTALAELQHWEQAPANAARVEAAGLRFALSTRGLRDPAKQFWPALRRAVAAGLSEDAALRALTVAPAELLGASDRLGRIAPGQLANLVVAEAGLLRDAQARMFEVWVEGERFELAPLAQREPGTLLSVRWHGGGSAADWSLEGSGDTRELVAGDVRLKLKRVDGRWLGLPESLPEGWPAGTARIELTQLADGRIEGFAETVDGRRFGFGGRGEGQPEPAARCDETAPAIPVLAGYPAGEYARERLPEQPEALLFRGATVWTNDSRGVLENADVLVRRGRIAAVGTALSAPAGARVVEAAGMHLTAGIIDAHSHTAISRNVNEPSHAVTTEVRVADVLDPTDINLYRQLAGGVTSANLLHGSANPMGGQNAVIKLRWGADAAGLVFEGAPSGVKFALGENVKQSNWGEGMTTRYPQTRMGVEQILRDHFLAARGYEQAVARGEPVRPDLRLDALVEILRGERLVHIHSYRQDEILMFVRLAQEFGFRVASFQHVLEGYKVARELAEAGAGASTFSDWWAFKMEVADAIPYNGALMVRAGVVTSFNSDSNELARRLNTEAAKALRYGGLSDEEAWKLVTLNPAIQLGVEKRVGAIREGLDADLVLWNAHPMSSYAVAQQTWIDGRLYFDRAEDLRLRLAVDSERERLIALAAADRRRSQSMQVAAKPAAPSDPGVAAARMRMLQSDLNWLAHFGAFRGLYHDGAELNSCGKNDHVH
ncbi:MAG: amidohydrolase family protein [Aquimonas sp.]|nr:amidohydrolase family protein [Aquimonas sp.]